MEVEKGKVTGINRSNSERRKREGESREKDPRIQGSHLVMNSGSCCPRVIKTQVKGESDFWKAISRSGGHIRCLQAPDVPI